MACFFLASHPAEQCNQRSWIYPLLQDITFNLRATISLNAGIILGHLCHTWAAYSYFDVAMVPCWFKGRHGSVILAMLASILYNSVFCANFARDSLGTMLTKVTNSKMEGACHNVLCYHLIGWIILLTSNSWNLWEYPNQSFEWKNLIGTYYLFSYFCLCSIFATLLSGLLMTVLHEQILIQSVYNTR